MTKETIKADGKIITKETTTIAPWWERIHRILFGQPAVETRTTVVPDPNATKVEPVRVIVEGGGGQQEGKKDGQQDGQQDGQHGGQQDGQQDGQQGGQDADVPIDVVDGDAEEDPVKIAPVEPGWVDQKLGESLAGVMQEYQTMKFSTPEGAQAYLDAELAKTGIGMQSSSTGQTVVDAGPQDPLGVEKELRDSGVKDRDVISQAVAEVNDAVALFEGLVRQCQADLSSLDPTAADYTDELNSRLAGWNQVLQDRLSVDPPSGSQTTGHVSFNVLDGIAAAMVGSTGQPASATSATGLTIRAGIGAVRTSANGATVRPLGNVQPGYEFRATPFVSVFSDEAWKLMA